MNLQEARKAVQAMKPRDTYMVIRLDYDTQLVLPHKDGVAFLNTIVNAEQLTVPYGKPPELIGLKQDKIQVTIMSREDYERYKMAMLLRVTVEDVRTLEIAESQPTPPTTP